MTETAAQIVQWAEEQDERKPQGAPAHLSSEQKQAIRLAYLERGGSETYIDLGRRCVTIIGRAVNRETVAACLKGPEYKALREQFEVEIKATAMERLRAGILPAADAWVRAVEAAADKGDHKPAKELLMHTDVIEPLGEDRNAGVTIQIGIKADAVTFAPVSPSAAPDAGG